MLSNEKNNYELSLISCRNFANDYFKLFTATSAFEDFANTSFYFGRKYKIYPIHAIFTENVVGTTIITLQFIKLRNFTFLSNPGGFSLVFQLAPSQVFEDFYE